MQTFKNNVIERFLKVSKDCADNKAFCIKDVFYTYMQFCKKIATIQQAILKESQKYGAENSLVCVVCNDDIETYASLWALWLLGRGYVPLHPEQPLDRNNSIISQVDAHIVLDSVCKDAFLVDTIIPTSSLEIDSDQLEVVDVDDNSTAYILFTSGSTGLPKGVEITRGNVAHFVWGMEECGYCIKPDDKCLQYFDLTFDVSMQSFILPLLNGASVFTIPVGSLRAAQAITLIQNYGITCASIAPSLIRLFLPYLPEVNAKSLRLCIVTAEASYKSLLLKWGECASNATIYDFYGPTECTVYCTSYKCPTNLNEIKHNNDCLTIGKVMPGLLGLIIDSDGKILPQGEKGELIISGPQLSKGYWNNPEKNAEAFFEMEYDGQIRRFYHTGDLCYFDAEGDIMYIGRLDFQAKIQGYRVELGEIEYHIKTYTNNDCVVLAVKSDSGDDKLYAFIKTSEDIDRPSMIAHLKSKMPSYMMPLDYLTMPEFPLNTNGKIDRKQLTALITK